MWLGDARRGKFADNVLGFGRMLRRAGLPIDTQRIRLAQQALSQIDLAQRQEVQAALHCTLVSREQDRDTFKQLFEAYFKDPELAQQLLTQMLPHTKSPRTQAPRNARAQEALRAIVRNNPASTQAQTDEIELDAAMSASAKQLLQHADFEGLSASEFKLVQRLACEMPMKLPETAGRRNQSAQRGGQLHWPRLLRDMARHDGDCLTLFWSKPRQQPLPLLILVDISGSMQRYARLLLAFLHRATHRQRRHVFAFGTQLTNLNPAFKLDDTDAMLNALNQRVPDFAGGTLISQSMRTLRLEHRQAIVANRSVVLLITDGLDTGDPHMLDAEMSWLSRQARQVLWLNPLLRYEGYQPLASGAGVLSRHVDRMLAIHNLAHLQTLASSLADLLHSKRSRHNDIKRHTSHG